MDLKISNAMSIATTIIFCFIITNLAWGQNSSSFEKNFLMLKNTYSKYTKGLSECSESLIKSEYNSIARKMMEPSGYRFTVDEIQFKGLKGDVCHFSGKLIGKSPNGGKYNNEFTCSYTKKYRDMAKTINTKLNLGSKAIKESEVKELAFDIAELSMRGCGTVKFKANSGS